MFSGLISHEGTVTSILAHPGDGGMLLTVEMPAALSEGVQRGDSIAIDGVCLTAVDIDSRTVTFEVVPESVRRSTIGRYLVGQRVNVELSLRLGDRLGGHLVYAHIDATVELLERRPVGQGYTVRFSLPDRYAKYIVEKGYVALDGVSLTVADVQAGTFAVAMIPETAERTTLGRKAVGDAVNFEVDPIARYACEWAANYLGSQVPAGG